MAIRNFAQETFGSGGLTVPAPPSRLPRQQFQFTLLVSAFGEETATFDRVSSVTVPSFQFDTMVANQYNRKRVVQTKINYDPVTVTFYDTHDSQWHLLFQKYVRNYYHSVQGIESVDISNGFSTVDSNFDNYLGYTPTSDAARYFFPEIALIQPGHPPGERVTVLKRPMITSMNGDTLDYSSSQPVMYTVTFQPESIEIL